MAQSVRCGDRDVPLAPQDIRLLESMRERHGSVLSHAQLLDAVCGRPAEIDERAVHVFVGHLRKMLSKVREPDPIRTLRGG